MARRRIFQCVVITPLARLLNCQTTSVILPAHDGLVGIWYNHMPMFCKLGLGIMEVKRVPEDIDKPIVDALLLIDGGFTLASSNLLTVIAYDAICFQGLEKEKVERILEKTRKKLTAKGYTVEQLLHNSKKLSLLMQLAQRSTTPQNKHVFSK